MATYRYVVIDVGYAKSVFLLSAPRCHGVKVIDADGNVEGQGLGFVVKGLHKTHVTRGAVDAEEILVVSPCKQNEISKLSSNLCTSTHCQN